MQNQDFKLKHDKLRYLVDIVNKSDLASIKHTVIEIIQVINDPNSSANRLKQIIEFDPPLSAKILRLANSAIYASKNRIDEIKQAIVWLGFNRVKELALAQKICEIFNDDTDTEGYSRLGLWKHSVAVAICAKKIYRQEFREQGENIYAAGLLHDIGIIAIEQFMNDEFNQILKNRAMMRNNILNAENSVLGFNHMEVGGALAMDWGFPNNITKAIDSHHTPLKLDARFDKLKVVLYISDYLCQREEIGFCDTPYLNHSMYKKSIDEIGLNPISLDLIIENVIHEVDILDEQGWFS